MGKDQRSNLISDKNSFPVFTNKRIFTEGKTVKHKWCKTGKILQFVAEIDRIIIETWIEDTNPWKLVLYVKTG